jgi:DNA ligase (NAD+)
MSLAEMTTEQQKSLFVRASALYHSGMGEASPISDDVYDQLKRHLTTVDPWWPPLKQAGWKPNDLSPLELCNHKGFMGSINNAYDYAPRKTPEEQKWEVGFKTWRDVMGESVWANHKVDGLSVAVEYQHGQLVMGLTRGDCVQGENITHHLPLMRDVPSFIQSKAHVVVRGEVVFTTSGWEEYKKVCPNAKVPRNMAAGIMGRKEVGDSHYLRFFAHGLEVLATDVYPAPNTIEERFDWLKENGFATPQGCLCSSFFECQQFFEHVSTQRENGKLAYEIDGVVYTINNVFRLAGLGVDSQRCHRGQVAWKFPAMGGITTLKEVAWQVGHTGAISPVGIVLPVMVGGVTIQRASLANPDEIKRLDVALGDQVEVSRMGDVIPKITSVVGRRDNRQPIVPPTTCPECGGTTGKRAKVGGEAGAVLYCKNVECPAQSTGKIHKWVISTNMLGIGKNIIQAMVDAQLADTPADLYRLDIIALEQMKFGKQKFGHNRATKVIDTINAKKSLPLDMFLGALGVQGLGEGVVGNVRERMPGEFDTLGDWIDSDKLVTHAEALSMPNTAKPIHERLIAKRPLIINLLGAGVTIEDDTKATAQVDWDGPAKGMVFCLTGSFPEKKSVYYERIKMASGQYEEDVRDNVTHVVVQDKTGKATGKRAKAEKKGIPVCNLTEFFNLLGSEVVPVGTAQSGADQPEDLEGQLKMFGTGDEDAEYPV